MVMRSAYQLPPFFPACATHSHHASPRSLHCSCAPIRRMKANEFKLEAGMVLGEDCIDYTADKRCSHSSSNSASQLARQLLATPRPRHPLAPPPSALVSLLLTAHWSRRGSVDVHMDPMVEELLRVCCSDDAKANVTASSIKADLEEQARKAMMALRGRRESSVCEYTGPRTIVAMGKKISVAQVWCSSMECSRPTLTLTPNPNPHPDPNPNPNPN